MTRGLSTIVAVMMSLVATAVIVVSLGFWTDAGPRAQTAIRPDTAEWALKLIALSGICIAQLVLAIGVIPRLFRHGRGERIYAVLAGIGIVASLAMAAVLTARAW